MQHFMFIMESRTRILVSNKVFGIADITHLISFWVNLKTGNQSILFKMVLWLTGLHASASQELAMYHFIERVVFIERSQMAHHHEFTGKRSSVMPEVEAFNASTFLPGVGRRDNAW